MVICSKLFHQSNICSFLSVDSTWDSTGMLQQTILSFAWNSLKRSTIKFQFSLVHISWTILRRAVYNKYMRGRFNGTSPCCSGIQRAQNIKAFSGHTRQPLKTAYCWIYNLCCLLSCVYAYSHSCGNADMECENKRLLVSIFRKLDVNNGIYPEYRNDGRRHCKKF